MERGVRAGRGRKSKREAVPRWKRLTGWGIIAVREACRSGAVECTLLECIVLVWLMIGLELGV